MQGDAYELVRQGKFSNIQDFLELIRITYLKARSLDSVFREIYEASQRPEEDLKQYARRLQNLANTAEAIIAENYVDEQDAIIKQELAKKVKFSFVAGLREQLLMSRLLSSHATSLDGLLQDALEAQAILWRGEEPPQDKICLNEPSSITEEPLSSIEPVASEEPVTSTQDRPMTWGLVRPRPTCSFCRRQGHTREVCWERRRRISFRECKENGQEPKTNRKAGRFGKKGQGRGHRRPQVHCFKCGRPGHIRAYCREMDRINLGQKAKKHVSMVNGGWQGFVTSCPVKVSETLTAKTSKGGSIIPRGGEKYEEEEESRFDWGNPYSCWQE